MWHVGELENSGPGSALSGICGLLWMIRRLGFTLECDNGRVLYRWVRDFEGSFDHWFTIGGRPYAVATVRRSLGSWRLTWKILNDSQLLVGRGRRYHKEVVMACSEAYYCLEPIFELRRGSGIKLRSMDRLFPTKLSFDSMTSPHGSLCGVRPGTPLTHHRPTITNTRSHS